MAITFTYQSLYLPALIFAAVVCCLNIVFLFQYDSRLGPHHHRHRPRPQHPAYSSTPARPPFFSPPVHNLPPGDWRNRPQKQCARVIPEVKDDPRDVELSVWVGNGTRNQTAPNLGGLLFEDISQSGDGGLYAELIRNRAFQGSGVTFGNFEDFPLPFRSIVSSENPTLPFGPVLDGWTGIGNVRMSLDLLHPLSDDLQVALQIDIPSNAVGEVGFQNEGFWGINVSPQTYNASFYAQSSGVRFNWAISHFDVSLRSALTGEIWCKNTINVDGRLGPHQYTYYNTTLVNKAKAPNINNTFAITFDAAEVQGQTLYFDLISLFPETYKNRSNGLRKDLAEDLASIKPRFLRFPGGNNLEGYSIQRRWKWWKTIGPLKDRPGRPGDWTYYNTDGLGLLEYLYWCEDMEMEPLLAVYDGFSLDVANYDHSNSTGANEYPLSAMQEVLDEALEELEYCMGATDTYWGKKRAQHGRPEPFKINLIQIGNEGFFSHRYPERADFMYQGLKAKYPDVQYVFSALAETNEFLYQVPEAGIWDEHIYAGAASFISHFSKYDNHYPLSPTNTTPTMVGLMEYHVGAVDGYTNRHPSLAAAVAEAVYAIAGERNPNTMKLWCFAPLMQNLNAYRGTPYNLLFTADPGETVRSASHYQQGMFNSFHGTETLPVTIINEGPDIVDGGHSGGGGISPLYWVASIQEPQGYIYLKVVNAGFRRQRLRVNLDVAVKSVNGTILEALKEGDLNAFNYIGDHGVVPKPVKGLEVERVERATVGVERATVGVERATEAEVEAKVEEVTRFDWKVPPYSIVVLQFDIARGGSLLSVEAARGEENEKGGESVEAFLWGE